MTNSTMELLQESSWEELREEARKIEGDLDIKLSSYAKLGSRFSHGGDKGGDYGLYYFGIPPIELNRKIMAIFGNPSDHRATPTIAKSTEEEDHLIRSTKKIKSFNSTAFIESENEVEMVIKEMGENNTSQTPALQEKIPAKSFKEALTTTPNRDYTFDSRVEILSSDEEDED
ncbi:Golgi SNAP receptor complex member 1-2 [Camellia lanceoleosa]|uniref:Golgi SNAP receptor complex member 1-2 n=1 Tax=Camellia lanceoleosa TaxID=1840588 RepID=A0ACC0F4C5_9ERIC|nr:Golgi SNAP receptor complex member 1-2 [Camellia lanceoleosa]